MNMKTKEQVLAEIQAFQPTDRNWLDLDTLFAELWNIGVSEDALPTLFGVFERFPEDDGAGVLWSIVHGVESLDLDYEIELRASLERMPSFMGDIMLKRLEKSKES